jgi:hypothetical protein
VSDILVGYFTASKQNNTFTVPSHGLINGDTVRFDIGASGNTIPSPLVIGTWYYVVNAATDTWQVAATSGDVPIVLTDGGTGSNEAWSPAPTANVWAYELLTSEVTSPAYQPDLTEVNFYAQRGWSLKFMGQVAGSVAAGGRFWYVMQKQEPPS